MAKRWKFTTGTRPNTVTVLEREPGGLLHIRTWDPRKRNGRGNWLRRALGHRDRDRAKKLAIRQAAELLDSAYSIQREALSLGSIFDLYTHHRTPRKTRQEQEGDRRRVELFSAFLGRSKAPGGISLRLWEGFCDVRLSGDIDSRGRPTVHRRIVRARTVEADCRWLVQVFNWAVKWRNESGHYLMTDNPLRGYPIPKELNPRRPVATHDRYEALRAVSDDVLMEIRWNGTREAVRSYLSELLDLANGTGRRIRAICRLRHEDLLLDQAPYGAIRWPAATDKTGRSTMAPISPCVRSALDRTISGQSTSGFIFVSPTDRNRPISRYLASSWLRKAEYLAGLDPLLGGLWHPFRRKWATERKHFPDVDVAAAGGWKSLQALKQSYQHADHETMLRVVLHGAELREHGA